MFKKEIDYSRNKKKYFGGFSEEIEESVPPNSKVLDIGCSTGKLAQQLKRKKCKVYGIDIDTTSLAKAASYCYKVAKIDVDNPDSLSKELKEEKFDVITLGDILEHLKNPGVLLYSLHQYLKPNGIIVSTIPNSAFIWLRLRIFFGIFNYDRRGGLMDEDHLRFFSLRTAKLLFHDAGYGLVKFKPSSLGIVKRKYFLIKYLAKLVPTLFAMHALIIAQSKTRLNDRWHP